MLEDQAQNGQDRPANQAEDFDGYGSLDELKKAKRASGEEAKRLKAERDQFAAQLQQFQENQQRQMIPQRGRPEERLTDVGVPVDALEEYIGARIQQAFQPITQAYQGRNEMLSQYGNDYTKYEADVAAFIGSDAQLNQRYQRTFQADPAAAMEYAFLKYGEHRRKEHGEAVKQGKAAAADRAEAALPSSRAGDTRSQGTNGTQEALRDAWEEYRKTGNGQRYVDLRLSQVVSEGHLRK